MHPAAAWDCPVGIFPSRFQNTWKPKRRLPGNPSDWCLEKEQFEVHCKSRFQGEIIKQVWSIFCFVSR